MVYGMHEHCSNNNMQHMCCRLSVRTVTVRTQVVRWVAPVRRGVYLAAADQLRVLLPVGSH
jgi:hypothetical protein